MGIVKREFFACFVVVPSKYLLIGNTPETLVDESDIETVEFCHVGLHAQYDEVLEWRRGLPCLGESRDTGMIRHYSGPVKGGMWWIVK